MKNIPVIIVSVVIFTMLSVTSAACDEIDFRNSRWGMSKAEVKAAETGELIREFDESLIYQDTLDGETVAVHYYFLDNSLFLGVYVFDAQYKDLNDYIDAYNRIVSVINDRHGEPTTSEIVWENETYKNDPSKYGKAVAKADSTFFSRWETDSTDILLRLAGDNFEIEHTLTDTSKSLYDNPIAISGRQSPEQQPK